MSDEPHETPEEISARYAAYDDIARQQSAQIIDMKGKPVTPQTDDEALPVIQIIAGYLDKTATQGEAALIQSALPIFQRGHELVRPVLSEVPASRGRMTTAAGLTDLKMSAMVDRLCQVAVWQKFDKRQNDWTRRDPPADVAAIILSRVGEWKFPAIAGVITTPTMRPDGTILRQSGYDAATRLYHAEDVHLDIGHHFSRPPSRAVAMEALDDLLHLLKNFPTVTDVDVAVALSGIITPVARGAMAVAPMHAFRASTAGSGKSYLADVISSIVSSRPCPVMSVADNEAETEKRLVGLLSAAFPIICLDNVNGELGGDLLCQAIERPIVQIRELGASTIKEIESRATLFATGNALRVRGDMTRRTLICNLDAQMERPELRTFGFDPVEIVLADRGRYVGACLAIVRAHAIAGFPGLENLPNIASFSDWSKYVRAALVWLGCADPCKSMESARDDDPELGELRELLEAWSAEMIDGVALTAHELTTRVAEKNEYGDIRYPRMREIVTSICAARGAIDNKKLGGFLRSKAGRIVNGKKISKGSMDRNGLIRWILTII
jgi:putative DNA primase/helicase